MIKGWRERPDGCFPGLIPARHLSDTPANFNLLQPHRYLCLDNVGSARHRAIGQIGTEAKDGIIGYRLAARHESAEA
ncbi:MAG: hypothetical protein PW791_12380 [Neorhizobium sp.]|nr:hypothetical protein [Neorhizobium sp.]